MDTTLVDQIELNIPDERVWLLNAIIALIMFGVALDLHLRDFLGLVRAPKGPLIGLVAQFLLLPAFTFILTLLLRPAPSIALGMILVAACPGGNLSNFLTHLAGGNTALSVTMTAASTAVAVIMTPLNLAVWGSLHPDAAPILQAIHLEPLAVLKTVLAILVVPLVLGMACAYWLPALARRLLAPFKYGSILFFVVVVFVIFAQNFDNFVRHVHWVAAAVVAHNSLALAVGYGMSRATRLAPRDCRAITIEVGIQNSALGLAIVFEFFTRLGGMALLVGFWGIWHIISGLSLAWFWSRRPLPHEH